MKLLIFVTSIFSLACNQTQKNCVTFDQVSQRELKEYYNNLRAETAQNLWEKRWKSIVHEACMQDQNASRVLILDVARIQSNSREGLLYFPQTNTFYYFTQKNNGVRVAPYKDDLPKYHDLLVSLRENFSVNADSIASYSKQKTHMDAPIVAILNVDVMDQRKSGFIEFTY